MYLGQGIDDGFAHAVVDFIVAGDDLGQGFLAERLAAQGLGDVGAGGRLLQHEVGKAIASVTAVLTTVRSVAVTVTAAPAPATATAAAAPASAAPASAAPAPTAP